jgi:hypothetical protein
MFHLPGRFVTFFGYERTVAYPGGHRNVISTRRDMQPFRISDEEFTGVEAPGDRLFPSVRTAGDIAIPHTTATGGGTDFRDDDPAAQPIAEIFQGLRGSYESPETPIKGAGTNHPQGLLWTAWNRGMKLGVIASSDHYSTHQSYANVWAGEFTAQAIHDAMKQRHTFASTDTFVIRFSAQSGGRRAAMGEVLRASSPPQLAIAVEGATALDRIELIGNGKILLTRTPAAATDSFTWKGTELPEKNAHYYIRAIQKDKQIAWSSPIWVER